MKGLYQVEYTVENNKPIIYLFRRENREKYVERIVGFKPYFYTPISEVVQKTSDIVKIEQGYTSIFGEKLQKITLVNPHLTYEYRSKYANCHESDILFTIRYLIDEVKKIEKDEYRTFVIDIETTTESGFPNWKNPVEKITCISFYDYFHKQTTTLIWREDLELKKEKVDNGFIFYFNNEYAMLSFFKKCFLKIDPDIITGWNVNFDICYIMSRMERVGSEINDLSPLKKVKIREGKWVEAVIKGRVIFDMLRAYKKINLSELVSYSLDSVSEKELGDKKLPVLSISELWKNDLNRFIEYNRKDVELVYRIDNKLKIIDQFDEMRLLAGLDNINSCFFYSRVIDTLMLRQYKDKFIFPSKSDFKKREEDLSGGYVRKPTKGLHHNVIVLDFGGLYPSIIRSFNLSRECITNKDEDVIKVNDIKVDKTKIGVLPSIIDKLLKLRRTYQDEMKKFKVGSEMYDTYWRKQFSCKFLVNSIYGVNALTSFRMYDVRIANTITFIGRELNKWMTKIAEEKGYKVLAGDTDSIFVQFPKGTDAVKLGIELCDEINIKLDEYTKKYDLDKHYFKLEFEKVYKSMLIGAKKRYAGWLMWKSEKEADLIDFVGFEVRRSDSSALAREIQKTFLTILLKGTNLDDSLFEAYKYVLNEAKKIMRLEYDYEKIAIPSKLEKDISKYGITAPRLRGATWSNENLNTNYSAGDKFLMLWVDKNKMKTDAICFDNLLQLEKLDIHLDMDKMLDVTIFMKLRTIMEALGREGELELLKMRLKGQKSLGDFT